MSDPRQVAWRVWNTRVPEAAWAAFAIGNVCWMLVEPSWAMLPYHLTWISLLLFHGLGIRTWSRVLMWCLVAPVMVATGLLLLDPAISGLAPYDELIELPFMVLMLFVMMRLTNRRKVAMEGLNALSQHHAALLDQQREFVQNASHELRTPITVALAHAELAHNAAPPEVVPDTAVVIDELGRLRKLVDDLLRLATVEVDSASAAPLLALTGFIESTMRRWRVIGRAWETPALENLSVGIDVHRLVAAVDAILENAVRFTREGDRIAVTVTRQEEMAVLTVSDSGPGIPDDQRAAVLERFRRGAGRLTEPQRGHAGGNFGLGLAIAKAVAEAGGGHVAITRSELGGAAVSIALPAVEAPSTEIVARVRPAPALSGDAPEGMRPAPA